MKQNSIMLKKPHYIFFIVSLLILIAGIVLNTTIADNTIAINIHDTYYVITYLDVAIVLSGVCLIIGLVYYLILKAGLKLNNTLSSVHTFITIGSLILYCILYPIALHETNKNIFAPDYSYICTIAFIYITSIAQLLFISNIVASVIKAKLSKR